LAPGQRGIWEDCVGAYVANGPNRSRARTFQAETGKLKTGKWIALHFPVFNLAVSIFFLFSAGAVAGCLAATFRVQ
jgi:hypothetical protein